MWLQKLNLRNLLVIGAAGVMFSLQGCNSNDADFYDVFGELEKDIVTIGEYLDANNIDAVQDTMGTGAYYTIHRQGDGYKTIRFAEVDFHFKGTTLQDGIEFVDTYGGSPSTLSIDDPATYLSL